MVTSRVKRIISEEATVGIYTVGIYTVGFSEVCQVKFTVNVLEK